MSPLVGLLIGCVRLYLGCLRLLFGWFGIEHARLFQPLHIHVFVGNKELEMTRVRLLFFPKTKVEGDIGAPVMSTISDCDARYLLLFLFMGDGWFCFARWLVDELQNYRFVKDREYQE